MLLNLNAIGVHAATAKKPASKSKAVSKVTVKSSLTADVCKVLTKANIASEDYTQDVSIDTGGIKGYISSKYSKQSDCCVIITSGTSKTASYINYLHNPSKAEVYVYNATVKQYQKINSTQIINNKYIDRFIALSDASLKIMVNNSKISGNNDNIIIQTKLNKTALSKIVNDMISSNPQIASQGITDLQFTITIKKGLLTQVNEVEKIQNGNITMKMVYKIGYNKQNVKPFKLGK